MWVALKACRSWTFSGSELRSDPEWSGSSAVTYEDRGRGGGHFTRRGSSAQGARSLADAASRTGNETSGTPVKR